MAVIPVDIVARERGFGRASRGVRGLSNSLGGGASRQRAFSSASIGASRSLGDVATNAGRAIPVIGAFVIAIVAAGRATVKAIDDVQRLENRITSLIPPGRSAQEVFDEIRIAAIRTGVDVGDSAEQFVRIGNATARYGVTAREVLEVTEGLNKAFIVAGVAGIEASQGLRQLTQGLAKGTLDGDELRGVLEAFGPVSQQLAKELGIPFEELRERAAAGEITTIRLFRALQGLAEQTNEDFERIPRTLRQSFQSVQGALGITIAALERRLGVLERVGRVADFIVDRAERLARAIAGPEADLGFGLSEDETNQLKTATELLVTLRRETEQEIRLLGVVGRERAALTNIIDLENDARKDSLQVTKDQFREARDLGVQLFEAEKLAETTKRRTELAKELLEQVQGGTEADRVAAERLEGLNQKFREGERDVAIYQEALDQLNLDQLRGNIEEATDALEIKFGPALGAAQRVVRNFGAAVVDSTTQGTSAFREFGVEVINTLARVATQIAIAEGIGLLASSFGATEGQSGALIELFGGLPRSQGGGDAPSGVTRIVGERGPELFRPNESGTIVPNQALAGAGAAPSINIFNVQEAREISRLMSGADGTETILNALVSDPERAAQIQRF